MKEIPESMFEQISDRNYLTLLINPIFIDLKGLILLKAHVDPSTIGQWLSQPEKFRDKHKLENTINHVHLDYFTADQDLQKQIGEQLLLIWLERLKDEFPNKKFELSLVFSENGWELQMWSL
jgi:hypothetical protein